mmetsp:Transcript_4739/g.11841  ORF Transcript_4739/g.11841 Transcript_4739/m.11841 type:complete len:205 (-) Transcript_4739:1038-1652(-)
MLSGARPLGGTPAPAPHRQRAAAAAHSGETAVAWQTLCLQTHGQAALPPASVPGWAARVYAAATRVSDGRRIHGEAPGPSSAHRDPGGAAQEGRAQRLPESCGVCSPCPMPSCCAPPPLHGSPVRRRALCLASLAWSGAEDLGAASSHPAPQPEEEWVYTTGHPISALPGNRRRPCAESRLGPSKGETPARRHHGCGQQYHQSA